MKDVLLITALLILAACSQVNNSSSAAGGGTSEAAESPLQAIVDSSGIITGHEVECDSTECSAEIDLVVE